jgi:hypothetical protein
MDREPLEEFLEEAINHPSTVAIEDQLMATLADGSDQPTDD